ncbi:GntR family transcriptional regulator [Paraclostridium ghonii]|uniref:DNA-binding GntR family transcriptional regulator n=1 Tax=Paraclostridium ghonii TaxID=29358 RepID=A0ABU0N191_9FIRM|nr:GntR family transcriptional regulator [Paeniclostridium ghonii]MDQ0556927.1 DNA-binding GntR family transcriptional regulator [Paeniclostridium ghonii]
MYNWIDELVSNTDFSQNKPLRDVVYESLRTTIITGKIPVGERIIEKEYADKLKISRTPIREALKRLQSEELVEYIPKYGVVVKNVNKDDALEVYKIREALEILVINNTIDNITEDEICQIKKLLDLTEMKNSEGDLEEVQCLFKEFNTCIYKASKMNRLPLMISQLNDYLHHFRNISILDETRRKSAISEHKKILEAIVNKDRTAAEELIKKHLKDSLSVVLKEI